MKIAQLFALLPALLLASSLQAHTALATASPADGAVLHESPATLDLAFTEEVQLLKLDVTDAAGNALATNFKAKADASKTFSVALPSLAPASYKASWTVLGKDGHRVEGSLGFAVNPAAVESKGKAASHEHH